MLALSYIAPSLSQKVDRDFKIFEHTSFNNASVKYLITGIWNPREINKYNVMCIQAYLPYHEKNYFIIPNERCADDWAKSLKDMKALFLKNDSIAKANNVTSEINKNVSEKFNFSGYYGEGISVASINGPIVKKYSNKGYEYSVFVLYKYKNGQSNMEIHIGDLYLRRTDKVWAFACAQDFDDMIKAIKWSNFISAFNSQVREFKEQQDAKKAATEKQKKEDSLFD